MMLGYNESCGESFWDFGKLLEMVPQAHIPESQEFYNCHQSYTGIA